MKPNIAGADEIVHWFGEWPSFHDAEVQVLHIDRSGRSYLQVKVIKLGVGTDEKGRFNVEREGHVIFEFSGIRFAQLGGEDLDTQNVLSALVVRSTETGHHLTLGQSYGLGGEILVTNLKVRMLSPGAGAHA